MKLTKFFRRYSRTLLMFFMSLLLVVFLIGDVIQNAMQRRANPRLKIGEAFGQDLYNTDRLAAQAKQHVLARLGFSDAASLDPLDFYLLVEEARRMGVRVGRDEVKRMFQRSPNVRQLEEMLAIVQRQTGQSYDSMYDIVGQWLAVRELVITQAEALGNSLPRAERQFRDNQQEAVVRLAVLDSRAFVPLVPEPDAAELQAFFEEARDRESEFTEDEIRFGYRLPDRVRIEYLTVDPQQVEPKVRVREKDVQRYFEEHAGNYTKPLTGSTTAPAGGKTTVPMTYEEARERVREDYRRARAIQEAQSLVNEMQHAAYVAWQSQPRDEEGFRVPPPPEQIVSFDSLREKFSQRYPVILEVTGLVDREQLVARFDTRPAALRQMLGERGSPEPVYVEGERKISLSELALRVKGLFRPQKHDLLPVLNLLEPSPVLHSMTGRGTAQEAPRQSYFFRVLEAVPAGPPESLDEVRERLERDYKLLKAHQKAREYAEWLADRARVVGLQAAAEEAGELKTLLEQAEKQWEPSGDPTEPKPSYVQDFGPNIPTLPFTRASRRLQWVGNDTQKVQQAVFALAEAQESDPLAGIPVVVVEVARYFKWVIAQLEEVKPLYAGQFEKERPSLLGPPGEQEYAAVMREWMRPENVRQRCGLRLLRPEELEVP
jgi:hypothetical protein